MDEIERILRDKGPMLSGKMIDHLSKRLSISEEAARQRLRRTKAEIGRLKGLFQNRQAYLYLQESYNQEDYFIGLLEACQEGARRYYAIIKSVEYHHGFIEKNQAATYSFSTVQKLRGHVNAKNVLSKLIELNILQHYSPDLYSLRPSYIDHRNIATHKGVEIGKKIILQQFNDWAKKINLISFNKGTFHTEFGKLQWGFTAPSYIHPLSRFIKEKPAPGFVVADILIGNTTKEEAISFFVEKVKILKQQKGLYSFMPFLIVDIIDEKSLRRLKNEGIVVGFIEKLFGNEYSELLKSLINTVENAGAVLKKNPDDFLKMMKKLSKLVDGKINNIRGDLFELAVGYYHSRMGNSIDIGKRVNYGLEYREIDVYAMYERELKIAECKGYNRRLTRSEVKVWLKEKIPTINKWRLTQPSLEHLPVSFELWSSGGFDTEAIQILEEYQNETKRYSIEFYGPEEILIKAHELHTSKFVEVMNEYYLKEVV